MVPSIKEENVKAIARKDRMQQLNIKCDRIMHMARNLVTSTYCASASVGPESAKIQQHLYRDLLILVNISFL